MIEIELEGSNNQSHNHVPKIKVLGIGGAGSNMVNSMIDLGYENVEFIVANTDLQSLKTSKAENHIQIGVKSTKGLGAGANPEVGRRAAEEDIDKIIECVKDADIVFLAGGLGGGTGSGALPVVARALKENDILSVAVVTKPFIFEGKKRMKIAQDAIDILKREVDTLIVLPNQKLIDTVDKNVSLINAFYLINNILSQFVKAVSDIITKPGNMNVDFADIKTIMKQKGFALIGFATASGSDRAKKAALEAISSPLLENVQISGARGVLVNITGSSNLGLHEVSSAVSVIYEQAHEDASIVLGSVIDDSMGDDVSVSVIATGFSQYNNEVFVEPKVENKETVTNISFTAKPAVSQATQTEPQIVVAQHDQNIDKTEIDLKDLDIPSIMRKIAQEKDNI